MTSFEPIPEKTDKVAGQIVDAAFAVHKTLGPGLHESVYETCLAYELRSRDITIQCQVPVPLKYRDLLIPDAFRSDMCVDDTILVELKAVDVLRPIHEAQLLTYLKLTGLRLGFLINFNVPLIKDGIRRMVL